jgi:hypothetical protein
MQAPTTRVRSTARRNLVIAGCALLSLVIATVGAACAYAVLPRRLHVISDVIGYPTANDFNVYRYFYRYAAFGLFLPTAAVALFIIFRHRFARVAMEAPDPIGASIEPCEYGELHPATADLSGVELLPTLGALGRASIVGGLLALEARVVLVGHTSQPLLVGLGIGFVYVAAVVAVGITLARLHHRNESHLAWASITNSFGASVGLFGLYFVSRATSVTVVADRTTHRYAWLPAWVAIGLTLAAIATVSYLTFVRHIEAQRIERWVLLALVVPLALFVLLARLPGDIGAVNSFEEGQFLVGAQQTLNGAFPWRDLILAHGLFQDAFLWIPGMLLFGISRWAAFAGYSLLVIPLYWVLVYYLLAYLFRGKWPYVAIFVSITVISPTFLDGFLAQTIPRLMFLPLLLLLFALLLRRPSWTRAAAFTILLFVQVIGTPEGLYMLPAFGGTLVVYEVFSGHESGRGRSRFPRTLRTSIVGVVTCLAFAVFLAANSALGDFIFYFRSFVPDHVLTGGIPVQDVGTTVFTVSTYLPITVAVLYCATVVLAVAGRRSLRRADWAMTAGAIGVLLYYTKFLSRADSGHLFQTVAVALPFLYYVGYRVSEMAAAAITRQVPRARQKLRVASRLAIPVTVLVAVALLSLSSIRSDVNSLPSQYRTIASNEPATKLLGYATPGASDTQQIADVRRIVTTIGGPRARLWDFSNSGADMYFFLGQAPVTRYDNVSIAVRSDTQANVITELKHTRPEVVVYTSPTGFTAWDTVPNSVRHYDISRFLLTHYQPVVDYGGYVLLARNDLKVPMDQLRQLTTAQPLRFTGLLTEDAPVCAWGFAPAFFAEQPPTDPRRSTAVDVQPLGRYILVQGSGISAYGPVTPEAQVRVGTQVIARTQLQLPPPPGRPVYANFQIDVPLPAGVKRAALTVWVRAADGSEHRLSVLTPGSAPTVEPPYGVVDSLTLPWKSNVILPANASSYRWLVLKGLERSPKEQFAVSTHDNVGDLITFAKLDGADQLGVRVDNCSQWPNIASESTLVLRRNRPETHMSMQLVS